MKLSVRLNLHPETEGFRLARVNPLAVPDYVLAENEFIPLFLRYTIHPADALHMHHLLSFVL